MGCDGGFEGLELDQRGALQNTSLVGFCCDAARQELALHYMGNPDMTLSEIAFALGYSELSAFSRAFRSWTGTSPQRYRRGEMVSGGKLQDH